MSIFKADHLAEWSGGIWKRKPNNSIFGFSIDSRMVQSGDLFVAVKADRNGHDFISSAERNGAYGALVEEYKSDVSIPQLVVSDTLDAFHKIAHVHRTSFHGKVVGVTGSCGKTSTKDILGLLLGEKNTIKTKGNLNNHLGVPLTLLTFDGSKHRFAVVEAGINQLGEMSKLANTISPNLVIVTMIGPSHLEGLGTVENIASEKADLFLTSNKTETVIFPEDCLKYEKFQTRYDSGKGVVVLREGKPKSDPGPNEAFYSIWTETNKNEGPCQLRLWRYGSSSFSLSIPEMSDGMIRNAALAVLAACELGVSVQEISERLPLFRPSALRGKCFHGRGRSYFLDCYNANPSSMLDSIKYFTGQFQDRKKLFVLAGIEALGSDEKKFHINLGSEILIGENDLVILIGEKAAWFAEGLTTTGCRDNQIVVLGEMEDAISIVEDFEGAILFKGSRSYKLEKLLPGWAIDNELENETEC